MEQWLLLAGAAALGISVPGTLYHKNRLSPYLSFGGCLFAIAALLLRWYTSGRPPWATLYETAALLALIIAVAASYLHRKAEAPLLYCPLAGLAAVLLAFSALSWGDSAPLPAALDSGWLLVHVPVVILSYGMFTVSCAASIAFIVLRAMKKGDEGAFKKLDSLSYASIAAGLGLLVAGVAMGAIWAHAAWGAYWSWDPKETWSLITAAIYAIYLVSRKAGVKGEDAAYVSMLGFVAVLFTYLGVSYLIPGLHSYA